MLGTSVVNLIWRNLATMPGALEWTWLTVRPLYLGDAPRHAEAIRRTIALPDLPGFSEDTLLAAGIVPSDKIIIRQVLDSYQYTNALALVVPVRAAGALQATERPSESVQPARRAKTVRRENPRTAPPMDALDPEVARLVAN